MARSKRRTSSLSETLSWLLPPCASKRKVNESERDWISFYEQAYSCAKTHMYERYETWTNEERDDLRYSQYRADDLMRLSCMAGSDLVTGCPHLEPVSLSPTERDEAYYATFEAADLIRWYTSRQKIPTQTDIWSAAVTHNYPRVLAAITDQKMKASDRKFYQERATDLAKQCLKSFQDHKKTLGPKGRETTATTEAWRTFLDSARQFHLASSTLLPETVAPTLPTSRYHRRKIADWEMGTVVRRAELFLEPTIMSRVSGAAKSVYSSIFKQSEPNKSSTGSDFREGGHVNRWCPGNQ